MATRGSAPPVGLREVINGQRWGWVIAIAIGIAICGLALLFAPRLVAYYWMYWGSGFFKRIFYEDLGLPDSWSSALSVLASFFYALASAYLLGWAAWRVLALKANAREIATAFACYVFVYGLPHVVHGAADTWLNPGMCFNQRTGEPIKWYVVLTGGQVVLYDSTGFDKFGNKKQPVTQEICEVFDQQDTGKWPHLIANDNEVQFFSPTNGAPLVWYSTASDGTIRLFDAKGFDPITSEPLRPVTPEVVATAQSQRKSNAADQQAPIEQDASEQPAPVETPTIPTAAIPSENISPQCPGDRQRLTIGSSLVVVNPNFCQLRWWVYEGCVDWFDIDGASLGRVCSGELNVKSGMYSVRAVAGSASISIVHCKPFATGNLRDTCS